MVIRRILKHQFGHEIMTFGHQTVTQGYFVFDAVKLSIEVWRVNRCNNLLKSKLMLRTKMVVYLTLVSLLMPVFGWRNWRYKIFVKSGQNWVWDILVSENYPSGHFKWHRVRWFTSVNRKMDLPSSKCTRAWL